MSGTSSWYATILSSLVTIDMEVVDIMFIFCHVYSLSCYE